jgi:hypothetical protein
MRRLLTGAVTMTVGVLLALAVVTHAQRGAVIGQPAPEITGGPWINSEPLSLEKLRGRVVFVEFWTYG